MIRLAIRCRSDQAEVVLAALTDLAPAGFEQGEEGELTEFAIYGAPGELPELGAGNTAEIAGIRVEIESREIAGDWADRWREFHRPVEIAGSVRVRPPWADPEGEMLDVVIDPGRAFGTAAHPTTRMCIELLAGERAAGPVADLGTGSGVLAIVAARLGFTEVTGIDHEHEALEAAKRNAERNRVQLGLERLDLRREDPVIDPGGLVLANLTADLLISLAPRLAGAGTVIWSGVLVEQRPEVEAAFQAAGFGPAASREVHGWTAGRAVRIAP